MPIPAIHMVTQLWGQQYTDLYADIIIPSLLAPGNLPALADTQHATYEIHTTADDRGALERHPNLERLRAVLAGWAELTFVAIEGTIGNPYETMSQCHHLSIATAEDRDAALLFFQPDVVVGPGSLATIRDALADGRRLVLAPGLRASREAMTDSLRRPGLSGDVTIPSSRALVARALRHLHPISESLLWESGRINSYCSHLYWRIADHGLYARCAHMHPLMVHPAVKKAGFDHTIDWDYFYRACPDTDSWLVAKTSDEVCLIELSDRSKFSDSLSLVDATPRTVARFFATATEGPHRDLVQAPYVFMSRTLADAEWQHIHRQAETVVATALGLYNRPASRKLMADPLVILGPVARRMSRISDRLAHLKRQHPTFGGALFWAFRALYLGTRRVYRLIGRLQR